MNKRRYRTRVSDHSPHKRKQNCNDFLMAAVSLYKSLIVNVLWQTGLQGYV